MLEVIEHGQGPDVLMVHGGIMGARMTWSAQAPLADRYHLRLVNRRGFGNSPDSDFDDFDRDAGDVAGLVGPATHLVGFSYGGLVALLAAAQRPQDVRSLVLIEPPAISVVEGSPEARDFRSRAEAILGAWDEPAEFLPRFVEIIGGDAAALPSPLPGAVEKAALLTMRGRPPWDAQVSVDAISAARVPVLLVSGGHSPLFERVCDTLSARLSCPRVVLSGAGHAIPSLGEPLNQAMDDFWRSVERTT